MPVVSKPKVKSAADETVARVVEQILQLKVAPVPLAEVKPNPRNAKKHPDGQISLLMENYAKFGFQHPLILDGDNNLIAGHARFEAARRLGLTHVPVIRVLGLSDKEKRALALADNKIAELGHWDEDELAAQLKEIFDPNEDLDFDPRIIGFETPEIDNLLCPPTKKSDLADQVLLPTGNETAVTRLGDVWNCHRHKLICGDARAFQSYQAILEAKSADVVFTDPPYNVPIAGHVSRRAVRNFVMGSGEQDLGQFQEFLETSCALIARSAKDGAPVFVCMDWRHQFILQKAAEPSFGTPHNVIVWVKDNFGMGSWYRSQYELISLFVAGDAPPNHNFKTGKKKRDRSNVWCYPSPNGFGAQRAESLAMHPTVKPVALVVDVLLDSSRRGGIVLDPFGGSGTTMVAAERTGRCARLIELDPIYCDTIVRRWETFTNSAATLDGSGKTFSEMERERANGGLK